MQNASSDSLLAVRDLLPNDRIGSFNMNFRKFKFIGQLIQEQVRPPSKILDAASGIGSFALMLKQLGYDVHAIDHPSVGEMPWFSENGIERRKANFEVDSLPYENDVFDVVTNLDCIEHLHGSPKNMLEEFYRILKPGGYVVVETPNAAHLGNRIGLLFGQTVYDGLPYFYNTPYPFRNHIREYTRGEMKKVLSWSGFCDPEVITRNQCLDYTRSRRADSKTEDTVAYAYDYEIGFKLSSLRSAMYLAFAALTSMLPNLRESSIAIARKPDRSQLA